MKTLTIGRSSGCDIVIPDNRVSRVHGELSIIDGRYVYRDTSTNGSTLNGEYISNRGVAIAPGAPVMLSNRVPLPWAQIYAMMPLPGNRPPVYDNTGLTHLDPIAGGGGYQGAGSNESASFGWCLLSFIIPLLGWILYFVWKNDSPKKASDVATWAWIGFGVNLILTLSQTL